MAILTADDQPIYFPGVALTGDELTGAIALTQSLIEAEIRRPIEVTEFTEQKRLSSVTLQTCQLSYSPIVETPAPAIRARASGSNLFRRPVGSDWQTLTADQFTLTASGRLELATTGGGKFGRVSGNFTEIEAVYSAGLDFSQNTPEIAALKAAAGRLLAYCQSLQFGGVTSLRVDGEYSETYSSAAPVATLPRSLTRPFAKYRPKSW